MRLFDDGSEIAAGSLLESKICSRLLTFECCFSRKNANFEFCFDLQRGLKPSGQVWGWSHWKARGRIWYQLCRNFPASWSRLGAAVKNVFGETRFSGGGCLSPEL
jgi:hypothetical protein